jgi:hypothetical protein
VEATVCAAKPATGYTYARREPEKTALYQVLQNHLLTFEQEWTEKSEGRTLPSFVTGELHDFLGCGILARGLAQHLTGYFGVLSSHSSHRSECVPVPAPEPLPEPPQQEDRSPRTPPLSHYISWSELLRRTFQIDTTCPRCKSPLRLIALIKSDDTIKKILSAMGLPTSPPKLSPARPPPSESRGEGGDWLN